MLTSMNDNRLLYYINDTENVLNISFIGWFVWTKEIQLYWRFLQLNIHVVICNLC